MEGNRNNAGAPSPDEIAKFSDDKRFFLAVSNYMANVLKIDRNAIEKMLSDKIEARNVDQAVLEAVQRYFGVGANAMNVQSHVKERVDRSVDEHVKAMFRQGAGGWIDKLVQDKLDLMAGNMAQAELEAARHPALTARRPNLDLYAGAAYLKRCIAEAFIASWLKEKSGRELPFELKLEPGKADWPVQCLVKSLEDSDAPMLEGLSCPSGACRIWTGRAMMGEKALRHILAGYLGWREISRLVTDGEGLVALPAML